MGILVGLLFPVVATVLDLFLRGQSPTMTAFLQVQTTQPLHWIIDTTPIFLGLFAALRKHIENKLQESRETFELAVRGSSDGIWHAWINPTDYFHPRNEVYYSPRFKELVGYTNEEFENTFEAWGSLLHPDDAPRVVGALRANLDRQVPYDVEFRLRTKSGEYRWFHARAQAVWDEHGTPIRMAGSIRDITDRKQTEDALKNNEKHLALIFNGVSDLLFLMQVEAGLRFRCLAVNHSYLKTTGMTDEQLVGKFVEEILPPKEAHFVIAHYQEAIQTRNPITYEEIVSLPTGQLVVETTLTPVFDEQGHCLYLLGAARNITERKQVEEALRESEERYRNLFENANDGIVCLSLDGTLTSMNRGLEAMLGWSREEMSGYHFRKFLTPSSAAHLADRTRRIEAGEKVSSIYEVEVVRKDGSIIPLEARARYIYDKEGKPVGILAIHRDITARKRAEEALKHAKEVAEAANRAKSEFLANMSHEIRTPMNGILGMLELALHTDLTLEQGEYLQMAKGSADALLTVINDILDFSKVEAGKLTLDPIDFSLRDSISDAVQALALRAQQKGIELLCHVRPDVPDALVGDPSRLRQVLVNLIGNAIKFTEQGEVVVEVSRASSAQSQESKVQHTEHLQTRDSRLQILNSCVLHFAVRDTGIGIPADKQRLIFDPFAQADGSTTRRYGGTGLGLAISSQLITLMGGRIWLESEVGKGSTFSFTVQCTLQKEAEIRPHAIELLDLRNLPVLVVDDNATNRCILEELLTHWHMKPTLVDNGSDALAMMRQAAQERKPFPLVLLDVHMPEMDGFMLAAQIKQSRELSETAIVMLTSGGQPDDMARCRELGIARYLMKPIKQSELKKALLSIGDRYAGTNVNLFPAVLRPVPSSSLGEQERGGRKTRVLLVEDNAVNQKLAVRLLEKRGYAVAVANNGREALDTLDKALFDIVLMDVQMPEMDGLEATATIRAKERSTNTHLPIIAMTAHAMKGDRERCLAAGMDDYVSKPLKPNELFETIERRARFVDIVGREALTERQQNEIAHHAPDVFPATREKQTEVKR